MLARVVLSRLSVPDFSGWPGGMIDVFNRCLQSQRLGGREEFASPTLEEWGTQLNIDVPDKVADAGLGNAEQPRRVADRPRQHDRSESFDVAQVYHCFASHNKML